MDSALKEQAKREMEANREEARIEEQ